MWRGIKPSGEGEREMSRKAFGNFGERKPLEAGLPSVAGGEAGMFGLDRRGGRRLRDVGEEGEEVEARGLRDRSAAGLASASPDMRCRRDADLVVGARYPSRASELSDNEGEGDVTRGVSGIDLDELAIAGDRSRNSGSGDVQREP